MLCENGWTRPWFDVVYDYHHYHDTAFEVVLAINGRADVQWGGEEGPVLSLESGDLAIIPPGVAHCQLDSSDKDFVCAGSYPEGFIEVANLEGVPTPSQLAAIKAVPLFAPDPASSLPCVLRWLLIFCLSPLWA